MNQTSDPLRPERVQPCDIAEVAAAISARVDFLGVTDPATAVTGVTLRGQDVRDGDLFAALPGNTVHGATFAANAIAAGARAVLTDPVGAQIIAAITPAPQVAVLVHTDPRAVLGTVSSRVYGRPSLAMTVIGITGTSGKTTTSYLLESALMAAGRTVGLIGTVETRIAGSRIPSSLTTPEAPTLQGLLALMRERGVDTVVMEVSSHALTLGRVAGTQFSVGAFTNLSQDHLDFHPTMEDYFAAKAELFNPQSPQHAMRSVVCIDDEWGQRMADIAGSATITVSTATPTPLPLAGRKRGWGVSDVNTRADGSQSISLTDPDGRQHAAHVPFPGYYNVANAAVAIAIAAAIGVDVDQATLGIASVSVPGRVEVIDEGQDFLAVVDYAHKPAAVQAVISTLRAQSSGRLAVVVGAGGNRDTGKRPKMGAAAAQSAHLVIVTDDNPRDEDPANIRAEVLAGANAVDAETRPPGAEASIDCGDRAAAIAAAVDWANTGDIVLIAGKGHETGQQAAGVTVPFDDRLVLAQALRDRHNRLMRSSAERSAPAVLLDFSAAPMTDVQARSALRDAALSARDHQCARVWAVLGEFAVDGAEGAQEDENARARAHDGVGRHAVRLAIDTVIAVGESRATRALHQGAVMEGSWGNEARAATTVEHAVAILLDELETGDIVLVAGGPDLSSVASTLLDSGRAVVATENGA